MDDRATVTTSSGKPWYFKPGNTAYRARQQAIEARAAELACEYVATGAAAKALLKLAATHLLSAEQARNSVLRARGTRLAMKVLASLQRKLEPQPRSLEDYLEAAGGK